MVDPQILLESTNQLKSSIAARDAAKATITKAEAELLSKQATLAKAKVDVAVARADLAVAESEAKRLEAWVGYLTLTAPFDGVIVARNANTFDFVLPATGDPTAMARSPYLSPGGTPRRSTWSTAPTSSGSSSTSPSRTPTTSTSGRRRPCWSRHYRDEPIPGTVTRTSWALNVKSRTLRAEIDLPNPGSQILPGMYAYGKVIIERPGVRALPLAALTYRGDQTFCWRYEDGHAVRTEIQTGVSDGEWIEVTNRRVPASRTEPAGKRSLDADRRLGTGDPRRPVDPHRGCPRAGRDSDQQHQRADAKIVGQFHVAVSGRIVESGKRLSRSPRRQSTSLPRPLGPRAGADPHDGASSSHRSWLRPSKSASFGSGTFATTPARSPSGSGSKDNRRRCK